ncbi:MAG TPA: hypothetical protein PLF76_09415 [Methanomassiliicoccaceae archaeon]|nr:hypothetical protein [Methanomassiliicoccaceae archaeon]
MKLISIVYEHDNGDKLAIFDDGELYLTLNDHAVHRIPDGLLGWARDELGHDASDDEVAELVEEVMNGEHTELMEQLYDWTLFEFKYSIDDEEKQTGWAAIEHIKRFPELEPRYRLYIERADGEREFDITLERAEEHAAEYPDEVYRDHNTVRVHNELYDFDRLLGIMDDDIREEVHRDIAPCTKQEFIDEYIKRDKDFKP